MARAIGAFIARSAPEGKAVLWTGDPLLKQIAENPPEQVDVVSVSEEPGSDFRLVTADRKTTLEGPGGLTLVLDIPLPGKHNLINASLAAACAVSVGVEPGTIRKALAAVRAVGRRQNHIASVNGVHVYDDYAHHPTEIEATLEALRPLVKGRIVAVFQPHRYTRTKALMERFGEALSLLDAVILLDIYAAGEEPLKGVNSARLAELLLEKGCEAQYIRNRALAVEYAAGIARPGDAVVTLGAGDVGDLGPAIVRALSSKHGADIEETDATS